MFLLQRGEEGGFGLNESLAREVTQTLNLSSLSHLRLLLSATKKKYKKVSCAKILAHRGMGMRGRGSGDDAPGCREEWGCSGGTALAGQRWARVTVGWGDGGLGRRCPLDSAAGARAVGCGAPARDNFGVGGIGRRRFGRASGAAAAPGASLRHWLLEAPGSRALARFFFFF